MYNRIFKNSQINLGVPFQVISKDINRANSSIENTGMDENPETLAPDENIENKTDNSSALVEEILINAKAQAEKIIQEAQAQSSDIIKKAQAEAVKIAQSTEKKAWQKGYDEGCHKGYDEGYNKGLETAEKNYESMIKEATEIKKAAEDEYKHTVESMEGEMIEVILQIARKAVCEEIQLNKKVLLGTIREAFDKSTKNDGAVLKVSSDDYDFIIENRDVLITMLNGVDILDIKKDASLKSGAIIVETSFGTIDASVDTRLQNIREELYKLAGEFDSRSIA